MTEVWSVDLGLVVPWADKWVSKKAIVNASKDKRKSYVPPSGSPHKSSGVLYIPQQKTSLDVPTSKAFSFGISVSLTPYSKKW